MKISQKLDNKQDRFFDSVAMPSTATITSDPFRFAELGSAVELAIVASEDFTSTADITIVVKSSSTVDGSYVAVQSMLIAAGTYEAGDELALYTPNTNIGHYATVDLTTTEDLSTKTIIGTLYYVA